MPFPSILKKLSSKSLRPKSSSRPSTPNSEKSKSERKSRSESSPPLPTPPAESRTRSPLAESSSSEKETNGTIVTMPTPITAPPAANGNPEFSPEMVEAWNASHKEGPKAGGVEKFLNKIEDGYANAAGTHGVVVNTLLVPVKALAETSGLTEAIEKGVNGFLESVPSLMKALDEVAKVHPFISVAVLAFKAVYTLEVTRRENEKKIIALFVEMKDMMAVLVQLKDIKDVDQAGPDGETIKGRLQALCAKSATDIKECANTCDTYSKKKLVVKIFAGPIWEGKLVAFVGLFTKRRQEFEFSLTIHTAVGVDEANLRLIDVDARTREIDEKMAVMLQLFQKFVTPEQHDVALYIKSKGIDPTFKDEDTVRDLMAYEAKVSADHDSETRRAKHEEVDVKELRREIVEDPEKAIKINAELFDRKFDIQRRQIEADVARAVRREGDRVIAAVTSGPHDRIIDPDVYAFWREMGWKGSVKARHFIAALRDYYQEKASNDEGNGLQSADKWTLQFINPNYAQQLQEAFDDDASGFVTVQEVNRFTQLRPRDWSLPHWLAYWSVGWQAAVTDYCTKIDKIFTAMFDLLDKIKPMNRRIVDEYLVKTWDLVMVFSFPVQKFVLKDNIKAHFEPWVTSEEERIKKNLEEIRYDIDSLDTVSLITGPGRIEMYLFPLFYLILKRHLEIITLGQTHVIGKDELFDAHDTVYYLSDVAFHRLQHMRTIFKESRLDVKLQLKTFARGMFSQMDETDVYFVGENIRKLPDPVTIVDDEILPKGELDPAVILNFPTRADITIDHSAFDPVAPYTPEEGDHPALGPWEGLLYNQYNHPLIAKLTFTLTKGSEEGTITAFGVQYEGGNDNPYTTEGAIGPVVDGFADVSFKNTYWVQYVAMIFDGRLDVNEESIRGSWMYADGDPGGDFIFKRKPEYLLFYPPPASITETPARTRWRFALNSVRHTVKRDLWSKSFFFDRFRDRKRYMELATREFHYGKDLDPNQRIELCAFYKNLTAADVRFYTSIINRDLATTSIHTSIWCDNCGSKLGEARTICLDCRSKSSVDFCEDPSCAAVTVGPDQRDDLEKPHIPTHDVIKVYTVLHGRYYAMTERKAKETLKKVRQLFHEEKPKIKTGVDDAPAPTEENGPPKATCSHCKEPVSLAPPCWACIKCPNLFICDSCDEKGLAFTQTHTKRHAIVRCQRIAEDITSDERLINLEKRLRQMERVLNNVLGRLEREDILRVSDVAAEVAAESEPSTSEFTPP